MIHAKHRYQSLIDLGHLVPPDKSKTLLSIQQRIKCDLQSGAHVITVLIDGVGYDSVCKLAESDAPILEWAKRTGKIEQNSAQWPSTTAVQITSLHTGLPVEKHGILEWVIYEPSIGELISPQPSSCARESDRGTLANVGLRASDIFPNASFYRQLKELGFKSSAALPAAFAHSHFNNMFTDDCSIVPFDDFNIGCKEIAARVKDSRDPSYSLLYIDDMDKISHEHTKNSPEFDSRLQEILLNIRDSLLAGIVDAKHPCKIYITADHGHMCVDPKTTVRINHLITDIDQYLQKSPKGERIPCSGGYRSLFLHALPEKRERLISLLREKLGSVALVLPFEELFELGFFEKEFCSESFWKRAGNIVILPFPGQSVVYHIPGKFEMKRVSLHGGVSREEMTTPLIAFTATEFCKDNS